MHHWPPGRDSGSVEQEEERNSSWRWWNVEQCLLFAELPSTMLFNRFPAAAFSSWPIPCILILLLPWAAVPPDCHKTNKNPLRFHCPRTELPPLCRPLALDQWLEVGRGCPYALCGPCRDWSGISPAAGNGLKNNKGIETTRWELVIDYIYEGKLIHHSFCD